MKGILRFLWSSSLLAAVFSCGNESHGDISQADREFLAIAGSAGIMEVEMGKLAVRFAIRKDLRQFGEMMVDQHSKFNEDFHRLLGKINVQVPEGMNEINRKMVEHLARERGRAFDSLYVVHMVDDHRLGVEKFKEALQIARNEEYKKFLDQGLHIVSLHYKEALSLQAGK
ncbi:DUF4142 domain-containing protein [Paraflavisolibacter sp. H34]|uniref:DUF4142 domain-containing protein n=1 Tax=Huijunlia imazamoxiresistens TaxID=3127457 RepID=UPI00301878E8